MFYEKEIESKLRENLSKIQLKSNIYVIFNKIAFEKND